MFLFVPFSLFSLISLFILLLCLVPSKWLLIVSKTHKNPPPSPRKLPVIGNLHQLGSRPHQSLQALSQKHGPLMMIHLGNVPVLVASSAQVAQEILKTHDSIFSNRPKFRIPHSLSYGSKDILFSPYGEYWRRIKSIVVLQLLSSKQVQSFRQVREDETALMLDTIGKHCGSMVDLSELCFTLTTNIVCRVVVGRTYHETKFKNLLRRYLCLIGACDIGSYIPLLSWVDWLRGLENKTNKVVKDFDDFLEGVIEEHVTKKSIKGLEGHDLVDVLLDLQRENATGLIVNRDTIKALILNMFGAGTETTSTTLEWVISEVIRHPNVMKKLQQEVTKIAQGRSMLIEKDLEKMPYLKATLKETLRLHTYAPLLVPRETTQDVKLMGYDIAARIQVFINVWAIGRDPSLWEDPEVFKPERFLNSCIDYKGLHSEFLPFGAGRRRCPGIEFGMAIDKLCLANLVYKYDLTLSNGRREELDMSETSGFTLHRKSPLLVVATSRF